MQECKKYIADDGTVFNNPFDCAAYELKTFPQKLQTFNDVMGTRPSEHQLHWCGANSEDLLREFSYGGSGCACMGCINLEVKEAGFTYYHWAVWFYSLSDEMKGKLVNSDQHSIVLDEIPEKTVKIKAAAFMHNELRNTHQEALMLFKDVGSVIFHKYYFARKDLVAIQEKLTEIGVKTSIQRPAGRKVMPEDIRSPAEKLKQN